MEEQFSVHDYEPVADRTKTKAIKKSRTEIRIFTSMCINFQEQTLSAFLVQKVSSLSFFQRYDCRSLKVTDTEVLRSQREQLDICEEFDIFFFHFL